MVKKRKKRKATAEEKERTAPLTDRDMEEKGEHLEQELEKLDEMIDQVLAEEEEDAELRAQRFVDGFKQEGGE
jgi:hypothetical protein